MTEDQSGFRADPTPLALTILLVVAACGGCRSAPCRPALDSPREARTAHYAITTDGSPEEAAALGAECERMLRAYERLLPLRDPAAFERDLARAPLVFVRVEDERLFHEASRRHGAGAVEGFFCRDGGECVVGPGLARRAGRGAPREGVLVRPADGERAAGDVHVLYHEGFHQYLARLGAKDLEMPFAEGLAEWYARRAAREAGQPFAEARVRAGRADLAAAAREVLARGDVLAGGDDLADARLCELGVSLGSYGIYGLWIAFLAEGEGGRLRPRLEQALARAIAGRPARVDLRGLFDRRAALEAAFREFAQGKIDPDAVAAR